MPPGSSGEISSGTIMLQLTSSTMESEVGVGLVLFHISPNYLEILSLISTASLSFCQAHATKRVEITAGVQMRTNVRSVSAKLFCSSDFLFLFYLSPPPSFSSLTVCLHRQKYTATDTHMHIGELCSTCLSCVSQ